MRLDTDFHFAVACRGECRPTLKDASRDIDTAIFFQAFRTDAYLYFAYWSTPEAPHSIEWDQDEFLWLIKDLYVPDRIWRDAGFSSSSFGHNASEFS